MRTVELVTLVATLVGVIATIVSVRRSRSRSGGSSPLQRWRAARASTSSRPE